MHLTFGLQTEKVSIILFKATSFLEALGRRDCSFAQK